MAACNKAATKTPSSFRRSYFIVDLCWAHFQIRSHIRILQAFLWPKIGKNQLLKAEKINSHAMIIWEVRVADVVPSASWYMKSSLLFADWCNIVIRQQPFWWLLLHDSRSHQLEVCQRVHFYYSCISRRWEYDFHHFNCQNFPNSQALQMVIYP